MPEVLNNTDEELEARPTPLPSVGLGLTAATLQAEIDRVLAEAEKEKPDAKGAFVAVADLEGYRVGIYAKLPMADGALRWSFGGYVEGTYKGDLKAGAEARLVF